ncbi:lymphocyte antigen 6 complex locus protein G6f-like [Thamnophis elegans]|uniref:lymphocyte antigen 6 complex locus protein G6f-like n=1 Tax=Thamnophis elegans TaxID=35005 RepID=UPI001378B47A|nr:lymphocyte antigen 6 complex locus protein G6f-like [Thamnophis elegans]
MMVLRKNLSSEMDAGVPTSRTAKAILATFFLLVQLCDANTVYAERGSSPELPCPCPSCSDPTLMSWYCVQQGQTALLFRKLPNNQINRFPAAWSRLKMLQNNSLQFHDVRDNDTGRYWCDMNHFYDLVVVRSSQQRLESYQTDSTCYILSCLFPSKEFYREVVTWWEGGKQILDVDQMGRPSIFKGKRASQLHICMKKEALEKTPKKHVKCRFARKTEITFKLMDNHHDRCTCSTLMPSLQDTRTVKNSLSSQCSKVEINGVPWIPLAVCIILQFLIILTLVVLWRRSCSQRYTDHLKKPRKDIPLSEYTPQIYENI